MEPKPIETKRWWTVAGRCERILVNECKVETDKVTLFDDQNRRWQIFGKEEREIVIWQIFFDGPPELDEEYVVKGVTVWLGTLEEVLAAAAEAQVEAEMKLWELTFCAKEFGEMKLTEISEVTGASIDTIKRKFQLGKQVYNNAR